MTILVLTIQIIVFSPKNIQAQIQDKFSPGIHNHKGTEVSFQLFTPQPYDSSIQYPLILHLHGAGSRGTDNIIHINDTNRAILAAVDIQKAIENMNKKRLESCEENIRIGIGVNVGEAVVGNIGAKDRLDYTVIGDSVNLAAGLEKVAKAGEILVSESVFREANVPYVFTEPKHVKVKGKEKPVKCYNVVM